MISMQSPSEVQTERTAVGSESCALLQTTMIAITSVSSPNEPVECDEGDRKPNPGLEQALESFVSKDIKEKISRILDEVQRLSDTEKLLLYLRLPGETLSDAKDDLEQCQTLPISTTRAEQTQAFHWIRCHLEECDSNSTLPKHEVYDEYKAYCDSMNAARTLSAPDFGKIIKCVFPHVKARRLGTRGNSKYCYSGIQRKKNVKPPVLPSLEIPSPSEKDKNAINSSISLSGADKIGEDQTLAAACLLVCEWANKLLGRVFGTLIELARFLVGGSYVSSKSMAAFVVMSSTDNTPQVSQCLATLMSPLKQAEDQMSVKRLPNSQQMTRKQQQQPKRVLPIPRLPIVTSSGSQVHHTSQKVLVPFQQQQNLHQKQSFIQPNSTNASSLKSPTSQVVHYYHPQSTPSKIRPITPSLMSPSGQGQTLPQTPSPFQTSPKFNAPGTPQNQPVTPSSANTTPRHTPNSSETKFLFTPIPNTSQEQRVNTGEVSPPTLRPTATHAVHSFNAEIPGGLQSSSGNDLPMSPSKQPRLMNPNPPSTPTRRPSSFAYPLQSQRTPQRHPGQQFVTSPRMKSPGPGNRSLNPVSPSVMQRGQELILPSMMSNQEQLMGQGGAPSVMQGGSLCSPPSDPNHLTSKQGNHMMTSKPCRYTTNGSPLPLQQQQQQQQQQQDYSAELESICNQVSMVPLAYQRSQSVPPLPQHALTDQRIHPLTPQTDTRLQQQQQQLTPSPLDNTSQHLNNLKEMRNRVGDVNNNGSRPNEGGFSARRNLTSTLLSLSQSDMQSSHQWSGHQFGATDAVPSSGGSEDQDMAVLESNLNDLAGLNTLDDATTEAVLRNICNNTSGVWPTGDLATAWSTNQPLEIMD